MEKHTATGVDQQNPFPPPIPPPPATQFGVDEAKRTATDRNQPQTDNLYSSLVQQFSKVFPSIKNICPN